MLCVEIKLQKRLNCDNFWIRSLMAIVFILCRCETVIFALGIIYSVCLKHKCQTLNILVIFLTNPQSKFRSDLGFSLKSDFSTTLNSYWSDKCVFPCKQVNGHISLILARNEKNKTTFFTSTFKSQEKKVVLFFHFELRWARYGHWLVYKEMHTYYSNRKLGPNQDLT